MEDKYKEMQANGNNNTSTLVQWMKNSSLLQDIVDAERKAQALFANCIDHANVQIEEFIGALENLAVDQHRTVEEFAQLLAEQATVQLGEFMGALENLAADQHRTVEEFAKLLAQQVPTAANTLDDTSDLMRENFKKDFKK